MPKLDGLEFIKTLKERDIRTPVIWISGQADPASQTEAWRAGITEFHRKPFRFDELQHSVEVALALGQAESSVREKLILHPSARSLKIDLDHEVWNYFSNSAKSAGLSLESFIVKKLLDEIPPDTLKSIGKR
jgi:DNA-binding response OmpR family regulator